MKSIGEVIRDARLKKKLSRETLEVKTKIKMEFIKSLENSDWDSLPDFTVVTGFVKNISQALGLNEKNLTALLRRDYPPKDLKVNPKPEPKDKFKWGPRTTFISAVVLILVFVFAYLGISYLNFIRPPSLEIFEPVENQVVRGDDLLVKGKTKGEVFVEINNQPVLVEDNGSFEAEIEISKDTKEVVVVAKTRFGKETRLIRKINVQLE